MPRRKRTIKGAWPRNVLLLSSPDFNAIMADFEPEIDANAREALHQDLAIAFAHVHSDSRDRQHQFKPNELKEHLRQILRTVAKLGELLGGSRGKILSSSRGERLGLAVADAMARTARPEFDNPSLIAAPTAPPIFPAMAAAIEEAAKRVLTDPPRYLPYIDTSRSDVPLNRHLDRLMSYWELYAKAPPTFRGDDEGRASPFIRFALACCRHLRVATSASALSKRAERLYRERPGAKLPKKRSPRGPTRGRSGHVVRKKTR
jgi:hypothetical protein